jgi:hypothetical protein
MLHTVGSELHSLAAEMTTTEWIVAGVLGLVLFIAVVKQLTKTALLAVVLVTVGYFVMHGQSANWSFSF